MIKGGTQQQTNDWLTGQPVAAPAAAPAPTVAAKPKAPAALTPAGAAFVSQATLNQQNEQASLNAAGGTSGTISSDMADLTAMGMSSSDASELASWYQGQQDALVPPGTILANFYKTPIFAKYFPGIRAQMDAGNQSPMSISDYVSLKNDINSFSSQYLPPGFVTDDMIGKMVASNINLSDWEARITAAESAAQGANPDVVKLMNQWYGSGTTAKMLNAYYLNPQQALQSATGIENQVTSAQLGGGLEKAGFSTIDKSQLMGLAQANESLSGEQSNINQASTQLGLTGASGARESGVSFSQGELISAQLGGSTASGETTGQSQVAQKRAVAGAAAKFQTGGTYGTGTNSAAGSASE